MSYGSWHAQLDNPNFAGWLAVIGYLVAAVACAWAGVVDVLNPRARAIWFGLGFVLLFLGINKQLNLQTLLIVVGRQTAMAEGWYGHRRRLQVFFAFGLAVVGGLLFWLFCLGKNGFARQNRLAVSGIAVLLGFVLLRAATINHVGDSIRLDIKDDQWGWLLEVGGASLIAVAAAKVIRAQPQGEKV